MRPVLAALVVSALLALLTACDAGQPPASGAGSAAGSGSMSGAGSVSSSSADTIVLERSVAIGEVTGAEEYLLGAVGGVTADSAGRIYVSDRMGSFVRVYGRDGAFLRQLGREGEGPGEYSYPSDLFFDDRGRLWVRDSRRATVLVPRAAGAIPDSVVETRPFAGYTNYLSSARSRLMDDLYWYPGYQFPHDAPARFFHFAYDRDGVTGDTIEVPPYETLAAARTASYRLSSGSRRIARGLNRAPFEPESAWELTPVGTILGGSGDGPLLETGPDGDTLRVIPLRPRRAVTPEERADSAAALRARIDSLPVPLDRVLDVSEGVRTGSFPDTVPGFTAVHTAADGSIWVRRWPPPGRQGEAFFDVHDPGGDYVRTVVIPEALLTEPPPFIDGEALIGVARDPATDVQRVVVYRLDGARAPPPVSPPL